jgi:hypothetical protein
MTMAARPFDLLVERRERILGLFVVSQLFGFFFLQKFAVPAAGGSIQINLFLLYAGLVGLGVAGYLAIQPVRLALFAGFLFAATIGHVIGGHSFSIPALLLVLLLYLPFIFVFDVSRPAFQRWMNANQIFAVVLAGIVIAQHIMQLLWGAESWPDLHEMLPNEYLFPAYNYMNAMEYGSSIYKPNGIFLLEPSFVSQFAAIAIVVEIVFFRRIWRLSLFFAMLLLTFSGSGLMILALSSPLILARLSGRMVFGVIAVLVMMVPVATSIGWLDQISSRADEFQRPGTSGYSRYAEPLEVARRSSKDPLIVVRGAGAGATPASGMSLPVTKMFTEYGLLASIFLFGLICYATFSGAPSLRLALIMFLYYNLGGGGMSLPIYVIPLLVMCAIIRIREPGSDQDVAVSPRRRPTFLGSRGSRDLAMASRAAR